MLQNPCKTLGFKKNMVYKIPPGGGGVNHIQPVAYGTCSSILNRMMGGYISPEYALFAKIKS